MQINTSVSAIAITTTSVTQNPGIEETSFDDVMQSVDPTVGKQKQPFPILQKLSDIVDIAAKQGKITAAEHDEYIGLLDDIQTKLEEFKKQHHECHHHRHRMELGQMSPEKPGIQIDPLAGIMQALLSQDPASFLAQTDIVALETNSLDDLKAWADKMIQEGKLSPKAQEAITAFIELREKFVAMLTNLKTVFSEAQSTAKVTESQASASAISNIVQNTAAKTDTIIPKDTTAEDSDAVATIDTSTNTNDQTTDNTETVVEEPQSEEAVADTNTEIPTT